MPVPRREGPIVGWPGNKGPSRVPIRRGVEMRHPEVLLAPLLMVADYYLTLLGAHLAEHSYRRHFKTAHYELNPFWQSAMVRRQWINLRHLAGVVLNAELPGFAEP